MNQANPDTLERGGRSASTRAAHFIAEHDGDLPVWVRAPKHGYEFYSGCSRAKLYEWAAKGFIRSVAIREPGRIKGIRLFHLASILAFIERCAAGMNSNGEIPANNFEGVAGDNKKSLIRDKIR